VHLYDISYTPFTGKSRGNCFFAGHIGDLAEQTVTTLPRNPERLMGQANLNEHILHRPLPIRCRVI
jgi:hypothetical protein